MNNARMDLEGYLYAKESAIKHAGVQAFERLSAKEQEENIQLMYLAKLLVDTFMEKQKDL